MQREGGTDDRSRIEYGFKLCVARSPTADEPQRLLALLAQLQTPTEGDTSLMKKYARGIPAGADPFEGVHTKQATHGTTVLSDALAYVECRVTKTIEFNADHDLFLAEVVGGELLKEGPSFTHLRGNGFHY